MPYVELSPNNVANCQFCHQKILKATLRIGIVVWGDYDKYTDWYHSNCYPKRPRVQIPPCRALLCGYIELPEPERRILRKTIWPNQVSDEDKPRIKLLKEFNKMTIKDLKLELERRELYTKGLKQELKDRLEEYLNNAKCNKANELLVFGYCKNQEKKHDFIIPLYLKQIMHQYFPLCV
eukprot:388076_1